MTELHPYYKRKEKSNEELVECYAWVFVVVVMGLAAMVLLAGLYRLGCQLLGI